MMDDYEIVPLEAMPSDWTPASESYLLTYDTEDQARDAASQVESLMGSECFSDVFSALLDHRVAHEKTQGLIDAFDEDEWREKADGEVVEFIACNHVELDRWGITKVDLDRAAKNLLPSMDWFDELPDPFDRDDLLSIDNDWLQTLEQGARDFERACDTSNIYQELEKRLARLQADAKTLAEVRAKALADLPPRR